MIYLNRQTVRSGFNGERCWVHARCARVPGAALSSAGAGPSPHPGRLVMTMQQSIISSEDHVSDVFSGLSQMTSDDDGVNWTEPCAIPSLDRWKEDNGIEVAVCDFTPQWLPVNQCLLGIGVTARYRNHKQTTEIPQQEIAYSVYHHSTGEWGPARFLNVNGLPLCSGGCIQWVELEDGDLLIPFSWRKPNHPVYHVAVARCRLVHGELCVIAQGPSLSIPFARGFVEPSLIRCGDRFWLTLRNDYAGYVTTSTDGLNFAPPNPWHFCNGTPLGSYNTQQHWFTLGDRLFLTYTRSGLDNAEVVRHRAPLLVAEVDQTHQHLLQATEREAAPNRGAQLGNFGVAQDGPDCALIVASEWMENAGAWNYDVWSALERKFPEADLPALAASPGRSGLCSLSGSDNSIYLIRATIS